jgi:hypothetical protein
LGAVYRQLIRSEPDPDRALEWSARAKDWAGRAKQARGEWALLELEVQIERGDPKGVQAALDEIRDEHLNEPGVAEATYRLLYAAGLLAPSSGPAAPHMPLGAPSEPEPSRLWTPGQDPAAAGGGKSAIWTP